MNTHFIRCDLTGIYPWGGLGFQIGVASLTVVGYVDVSCGRDYSPTGEINIQNGQISVLIVKPKMIRGNHYHMTKVEKFLILSGKGNFLFKNMMAEVNLYTEHTSSYQSKHISLLRSRLLRFLHNPRPVTLLFYPIL